MTITPKTITLALAVSFLFLFAWTSRSSVPTQPSPTPMTSGPTAAADQTRESEAGNVTVSVTPRILTSGNPPQFDVSFETHSVELDFDIQRVATLTDQTGTLFGPAIWEGSPPGGHHRTGILTFSQPLPRATQTVSLSIANVAGIQTRTFTWEVVAK